MDHRVHKGPGKLNQDGSEPVPCSEGLDAELKIINILLSKIFSLVSENLVELDRKKKIRVVFYFFYPRKRNVDCGRSVECAVYFNNIYILC
jgi:hypothetical protein